MKANFIVLLALILGGCSASKPDLYSSELGKYNFNYSVKAPSRTGIIQVFDDGRDTYLKLFRPNKGPSGLIILETNTRALLATNSIEKNLVLIYGLHDEITVKSDGLASFIVRELSKKEEEPC